MMGWRPQCYIPSFVKIGPPVLEKILKGFYQIWAWWQSLSRDPDAANTIAFRIPKEAPLKLYDGLESLMLQTKFREKRPAGSGEDFERFLP